METIARMTATEFYALDTGDRWVELIDGLVVVNQPKPIHALLHARLVTRLGGWTEEHPGRGLVFAPTGVELTEYDVYGPDISWVAQRNAPADLCIEIRSPTTWRFDVGHKKSTYEAQGLPELWLVDTVAQTVLVFRRSRPDAPSYDVALELGPGDAVTSPQLPGFALSVAELFTAVAPAPDR
jgi:Uma2 family endonuclease